METKENIDPSNRQNIQDTVTEMKRREKLYEKKINEGDQMLKENKKYMLRIQELNQQLLIKIRTIEEENKNLQNVNKELMSNDEKYIFYNNPRKNKQITQQETSLRKSE